MTTRIGHRRKYPWEAWFGQPRTVIKYGVDYKLSQTMMYITIRNNASLRGLRIRLEDTRDGFIIETIGRISDTAPYPKPETALTG